MATTFRVDAAAGELSVRTEVEGSASRFGHRLTIVIDRWSAEIMLDGDRPQEVRLTASVDSFRVQAGTGGVTPLSPLDKQVIRRNALSAMRASRHPDISFASTSLTPAAHGYTITGDLTINGATKPITAGVTTSTDDRGVRVRASVGVRQTDYGVKPYSVMLGALKVRDEVTVEIDAIARPDAA